MQVNNSIMCWSFWIGFIDFIFADKKLTDFTNLFSSYDFQKTWHYNFELFQRWNETDKTNLTDQTKFWLTEISKIENYWSHKLIKEN